MEFVRIDVPVNIEGGGQYPAGVLVHGNASRSNPKLVVPLVFYRSQTDFENGEGPVQLKDVDTTMIRELTDAFVTTINSTTIADYVRAGNEIIAAWLEDNPVIGSGNTTIINI